MNIFEEEHNVYDGVEEQKNIVRKMKQIKILNMQIYAQSYLVLRLQSYQQSRSLGI